jgi:hypothetical protein
LVCKYNSLYNVVHIVFITFVLRMCYLFYSFLLLLFRTNCIVLNSCRRKITVSLGNVELVQQKLRPSKHKLTSTTLQIQRGASTAKIETVKAQIDVDNSSNTISYLYSNAKQTYFYMALRKGLKTCTVLIEQY